METTGDMKALFTNAGRRTYLVEFGLDLEATGYPVQIHVSDCSEFNAAMHVAPTGRAHLLPPVLNDPELYVAGLLDLVERERFEVIFPLSDLDPMILSERRDEFAQRGCQLIVSASDVIARCNDKRLTFQFCREAGLPTPECWGDPASYDGPFPAIQKPILGSGSSGLIRVNDRGGFLGFRTGHDMIQPYIEGTEYGLDILNNLKGEFVAVCVKEKLLMRAGETDKAKVIRDPDLERLGVAIAMAFRHIGNLDCDVLRAHSGALYCIDFNPRFGGGYPATHLAGFNYLRAILDMVRGQHLNLPSAPRPVVVMKGISLYWCDAQ